MKRIRNWADVEDGGLYDKDKIKILICVILYHIEIPFSEESISNAIRYNALADYFDIAQAVSELEKAKNIIKDENDDYYLSYTGKTIATQLGSDVPFSVREKALKAADYEILLKRRMKENNIEITQEDDGKYLVKISMLNNDKEVLGISILVGSKAEAERVKINFLNDPTGVYVMNFRKLLGLVFDEEEI